MSLTIADESLASAWFGGFGKELEVFGEKIKSWIGGAVNASKRAFSKAKELLGQGKALLAKGKNFFDTWMNEDPLGATAGAAAILLGGVVIVSVSAAVIATGAAVAAGSITAASVGSAIVGGLAGLISLKGLVLAGLGLGGAAIAPILGRWFVSGRQFLANFNWQVTDEQLAQQGEAALDGWFASAGTALGTITGNVICGGIAGAAVVKFNPQAALHIRTELGEEVYEEVMSSVFGFLQQTKSLAQGWLFRNAFKQGRRVIKWAVRNSFFLQGILGEDRSELIKNWGEKGNEPWTFSENFEEWIENIPDKRRRMFTENFFEEFFDSCDEAVLVATGSMSNFRYP